MVALVVVIRPRFRPSDRIQSCRLEMLLRSRSIDLDQCLDYFQVAQRYRSVWLFAQRVQQHLLADPLGQVPKRMMHQAHIQMVLCVGRWVPLVLFQLLLVADASVERQLS